MHISDSLRVNAKTKLTTCHQIEFTSFAPIPTVLYAERNSYTFFMISAIFIVQL